MCDSNGGCTSLKLSPFRSPSQLLSPVKKEEEKKRKHYFHQWFLLSISGHLRVCVYMCARFEYPPEWCTYRNIWFVTRLVPHKTAPVSSHVLSTLYNHAPVYSVTLLEVTYVGFMRV